MHPVYVLKMKSTCLILFTAVTFFTQFSIAQNSGPDCSAKLENGILIFENSKIRRTYQWNDGNIITNSLVDKTSGKVWQMNSKKPDLILPGETEKAENAVFTYGLVAETVI
jgi:hypothetical protein